MSERSFEQKVTEYKRFSNGVISREEARSRIGDDWESVVQVASMQLAREHQDDVTIEELAEMFEEGFETPPMEEFLRENQTPEEL